MIVAVASAGRRAFGKRDVSEFYGSGWSKGADGYSYPSPGSVSNSVETYYDVIPDTPAPVAPAPESGEIYANLNSLNYLILILLAFVPVVSAPVYSAPVGKIEISSHFLYKF